MDEGLSIIYITNRKECLFHWFAAGLAEQRKRYPDLAIQVILVDYLRADRVDEFVDLVRPIGEFIHAAPLPSLTQGPHKLTKQDYFSGTLATNTGVVYCKYNYMVSIDDLTVLGEKWLDGVVYSMERKHAFAGAYRKDKNMIVENGKLISSEPESADIRGHQVTAPRTRCQGGWLFGASFGMPLEIMLRLNGCDEICTMVGTQDTELGQRLVRTGLPFYYDTNILTVESNEHHFLPGAYFARESFLCTKEEYFTRLAFYGITECPERTDDKYDIPWFINDLLYCQPHRTKALINTYDLRVLRDKVLSGSEITLEDMGYSQNFWWTGEPLTNY